LERVITYIDGFNLYFGLKEKGWKRYYWLDLVALARSLLKPGQELAEVNYFTARISRAGGNTDDAKRQTIYLDALATRPDLIIHEGHYLAKPQQCWKCGNRWQSHEEKMTDVNIATRLLIDAFENRYDTALLVSADSDLVMPVREINRRFADKRVVVAMPPKRQSIALQHAAHASFRIGGGKIRKNQLPEQVKTADGFILQRPATWE